MNDTSDNTYLSPEEMRDWLNQEISDVTKAAELRLREAAMLVAGYDSGRLSPEQADEQHWRYQHRWGEALPGIHSGKDISDDQILSAIDDAHGVFVSPAESSHKYKELFRRTRNANERSSGGTPRP
jgi:hypothetical protein